MTQNKKALKAINLRKIYNKRTVVADVSIEVKKGEVVGLLGPNGAGKTTSFYMIVGIIKPNGGSIFLNDENITDYPMYKRCRKGISYLPQEPSIFRDMTVEENLKAILENMYDDENKIKKEKDKLLELFKIDHVKENKGYSLSGGERRRVEIARALITKPSFLLLDEPFAGIDPIAVNDIQEMVRDLKKMDLGILITDHNVRETLKITDRSYIMSEGKILVNGTPDKLIKNKVAKKVYLGEKFKL
ncbi:MAG: LPS export ABC transporter ATP-binding protein [Candidatus Mcinerneyibacterium aminivorans]|uniref:LPS export ABC transporter ATP-binding protein n=1 Tax=Candidatus Mcinerneyibacterium aminivorans TaxID=2703815 RepID=A0A5D0MBM6_9BACT|nr:MAG: LPS export ABC transporter ATP-binding protein [Candidatus Mcinerneyibacterium aminivorans]